VTPHLRSEAPPATILVVDDERDVRETLCEVLEDAGFNVVCAEHGADALAQLTRIPPPAAILLDLFMPEMNGWRFAEQLKQRGSLANVPIIVVTAAGPHWGTPVPKERVLRKPFQRANLLKLLEQTIHSA
jgi:two-component system, chemotaxis family, chemotaxis protein CheY